MFHSRLSAGPRLPGRGTRRSAGGARPEVLPRALSAEAIATCLATEAASSERHILWDGEVSPVEAMSGETFDHNTIAANAIIALAFAGPAARGHAQGRACIRPTAA